MQQKCLESYLQMFEPITYDQVDSTCIRFILFLCVLVGHISVSPFKVGLVEDLD